MLVQIIPSEGTAMASGSGAIALLKRAPHPNAAKVFINWLLSKEGQTIWSRASLQPSARRDIPTDHIDDTIRIPDPKKLPYYTDNEEYLSKQPEQIKLAKEIFGHLIK